MAALYVRMINKGLLTVDDVPAKWLDEVKELLEALTETE